MPELLLEPLQSNNETAMTEFWQHRVGLDREEILRVFKGVNQHRYILRGAILKLNMVEEPLPEAPSTGYRRMIITREGQESVEELVDPDGNEFLLAPDGYLGEQKLGIELAVSSLPRFRQFYGEVLELPAIDTHSYACANTRILLREAENVATTADDSGPGIRYITIQVRELDELHTRLLERGAVEHRPPTQWGDVAYISFIRDPDNNMIELSQRANLQ